MTYYKPRTICQNFYAQASNNPVDSTTYYLTKNPAQVYTSDIAHFMSPIKGIVREALYYWDSDGVAGSNENISAYVRNKSTTTDGLIETIGSTDSEKTFTNNNVGLAVDVGELLNIKIVCPAWAVNPTVVYHRGAIVIEME